jgi:hypothetical protein
VVEVFDDGLEQRLENFEVEQETGFVELFADESDEHTVVMAVGILALAVVIAEVVAGGKTGFYGDLKHACGFPSFLIVAV